MPNSLATDNCLKGVAVEVLLAVGTGFTSGALPGGLPGSLLAGCCGPWVPGVRVPNSPCHKPQEGALALGTPGWVVPLLTVDLSNKRRVAQINLFYSSFNVGWWN